MSWSVPVISTLVVGVPSTTAGVAGVIFSRKAHNEAVRAAREQVNVEAFDTAREVYESAIAELRRQVSELRAEVTQLKAELAEVREDLRAEQDRPRGPGGLSAD
jgi:predicted RNase H-like nuclease (RuvC/YqgF family)